MAIAHCCCSSLQCDGSDEGVGGTVGDASMHQHFGFRSQSFLYFSSFLSAFARLQRIDWIEMNLFAIRFFNGEFETHVAAITLPAIFCIISSWYEFISRPHSPFNEPFWMRFRFFSSHSHRPRIETERMTRDNDLLGFALFSVGHESAKVRTRLVCCIYINSLQRLGAPIVRCTTVFISIYFFVKY